MKISKHCYTYKRFLIFICIFSICFTMIEPKQVKANPLDMFAIESISNVNTDVMERAFRLFIEAGNTLTATVKSTGQALTVTLGNMKEVAASAIAGASSIKLTGVSATTLALGKFLVMGAAAAGVGLVGGASYAYYTSDNPVVHHLSFTEALMGGVDYAFNNKDVTLMGYFTQALTGDILQAINEQTISLQYSKQFALASASSYVAYFDNTAPIDRTNQIIEEYPAINPFETIPYVQSDWVSADSYFPASAYSQAIKEYISTIDPTFNTDYVRISYHYKYAYGESYGDKAGYNISTLITAYDILSVTDSTETLTEFTPIFLYNPVTHMSNLTFLEKPVSGDHGPTRYKSKQHTFTAFIAPNDAIATFYKYGIFFKYDGAKTTSTMDPDSIATQSTITVADFLDNGVMGAHYVLTFADSVARFTTDIINGDTVLDLPAYVLEDGIPVPYDIPTNRAIVGVGDAGTVDVIEEDDAIPWVFDPTLTWEGIQTALNDIRDLLRTKEGDKVDTKDKTVTEELTRAEEGTTEPPKPTPMPPFIAPGDYFFPTFPDFSGLLDVPENIVTYFIALTTFMANCISVLPAQFVVVFWWIFAFAIAIILIRSYL